MPRRRYTAASRSRGEPAALIQGGVRDFLALNRVEVLPWDCCPAMLDPEQALSAEDMALSDQSAPPIPRCFAFFQSYAKLTLSPGHCRPRQDPT